MRSRRPVHEGARAWNGALSGRHLGGRPFAVVVRRSLRVHRLRRGSVAACDPPNVAHLLDELGVCFALTLERVECFTDEQHMEFVGSRRTQASSAGCRLTFDQCAGDVERVQEVLHSLGVLLAGPAKRCGLLRDRLPFIKERGEDVERTAGELLFRHCA